MYVLPLKINALSRVGKMSLRTGTSTNSSQHTIPCVSQIKTPLKTDVLWSTKSCRMSGYHNLQWYFIDSLSALLHLLLSFFHFFRSTTL